MPKVAHIVLIRFKESETQGKIDSLWDALKDLTNLIPGLISFEGGPYSSPEGFNKGYGHGFTMIFADETSRDNYLPHPEHERVRDMVLPMVDDILAFDYLL